jgi:ribosomal protein S18 acetylase RimI-like enzyme
MSSERRNAAGLLASGLLVLRKALPADDGPLADLAVRTFSETYAADNSSSDMADYVAKSFSPAIQLQEISDPASAMTVAVHRDGRGETFAGYTHLLEDQEPASVLLKRIYVDTAWKGSGLGRLLIEEAMNECRRRGRQRLWLTVWERNRAAIGFYEKMGFRVSGESKFELGDDVQTDFVMEIAIPAG